LRLLLDTHTLLFWLKGSPRLSPVAQAALSDEANRIMVSAATVWEIAIKVKIGKLRAPADLVDRLIEQQFELLSITCAHGQRAGALPLHHRDPFDRMLIAQAQAEGIPIVSNEGIFDSYGVQRIW
jgi:PIN domain nuclease of toxin-antitoxin system